MPRSTPSRRPASRLIFLLAPLVLLLAGSPVSWLPTGALSAGAQQAPFSESWYFPKSGHNLANPFLARWQALGGEEVLGLPLSEERYVSGAGGVLQTFTNITLRYDPTQAAPWDVQGQPLNAAQRAAAPRSALRPVGGCREAACTYFPETGHTLTGRLAEFWFSHGETPILGLPISEPFEDEERDATAQLFERAILEDHGPGDVRLQDVGAQQAEGDGLLTDPAFLPAPPTGGMTSLVTASDGLRLRDGPSAEAPMIALLPDNAEFIAAPERDGDWVPGYADGFAGWVSAQYLREAPPLPTLSPRDWDPSVWQGAALGETNVRAEPTTKARIVEELAYGDPVEVEAWVKGEEVFEGADLWAKVGNGRYIYGRNVGRTAPVLPPPLPADAPTWGRWIEVNLTQQVMVAYDGREPVRVVETTTGMAGWETPPGYYQILNRVANETMTSGAIGAEHFYKLEDVLFTQYFTERGHAIHFAWWRTPETIGRPGSHGCLNLLLDDARFFWDWAGLGTPLYIHY